MKVSVLLALLVTLLAVAPAFAIYVPSDGTSVTISVVTGWYNVYSQGVFGYSNLSEFPWAYADTEWVHISETEWSEYSVDGYPDHSTELSINGEFFDWEGQLVDGSYVAHTFSESHNYHVSLYVANEISFWIYDGHYLTNSGGLNVTIVPVPEPSSLLALGAGISLLAILKRKKIG